MNYIGRAPKKKLRYQENHDRGEGNGEGTVSAIRS
jgi:hypothetical protein